MKKIIVVIISALLFLSGIISITGNKAYACSCAGGSTKERLERSSVVFEGEVIKKGGTKQSQFHGLREYTFKVNTVWKGNQSNKVTIYAFDGNEASCGIGFKKGESYLVFSYHDEELLQTNYCSGNLPISEAENIIKELGSGTTIIHSDLESSSKDWMIYFPVVIAAVIIISVTIIRFWKYKKKKFL
ncbi:hypothetical protein [Paenibacillus agilis]|uniref:Tissue inhibitor of metalloproteinase n=1 Tax=Paenibacillus agilis TaxID=3020863 RepID=A0A559J1T3_9BACL|nr:hypothetical protein [Paenibacillus agilis]TVX93806.1 hypothetical protein FPZ44_12530 [Paenibacillus agilis]